MKKVTLNLTDRSDQKLAAIQAEIGANRTDAINRAVSLYHLVVCEGAVMTINGEQVRLL